MTFVIRALATGFGLGRVPYITGTAGSLLGIPIFLALVRLPSLYLLGSVVSLTCFAIWVSAKALPLYSDPPKPLDPSQIVIDEVVGFLWAATVLRFAAFWDPQEGVWNFLILSFAFFRLMDISKLGLVGWAERRWKGSVGIVMDDVFAGILGGLLGILFCIVYPLVFHFFVSL